MMTDIRITWIPFQGKKTDLIHKDSSHGFEYLE